MSVKIKKGNLDDFLASAHSTAKEIDAGKKVTRKKTVWVESEDLIQLLKPERTRIIDYLRTHGSVSFSELVKAMNRTRVSVNRDLEILEKYSLVHMCTQANRGHGLCKMVLPDFGYEKILLEATV